jgi:photosystem II stability/assembly factor-like uncharacterized protein
MSNCIKTGLAFSVTLLIGIQVTGQWTVSSSATKANLNGISFCINGSGWIVGDNGTMLCKVEDSWILSEKVTDADLYSIVMNSETEGWAVGSGGTILRYDGTKWTVVESPTRDGLFSVSFKDSENGVAVGVHGTITTYTDGEWQLGDKIGRDNLYCADFKDDLLIVGGGAEAGTMPIIQLKERSGKKTKETFDPGYVFIKDVVSLNPGNIWAVGMPGIIYHHNGTTWKRIKTAENYPSLNSICFADEKHGIAVGYQGAIMVYSENNWIREETPVSIKLNGIAITGDTYYAVGNRGTILTHKKHPDDSFIDKNSSSTRILIKNYPNPTPDLLYYTIPDEFAGRSARVIITNSVGQTLFVRDLQNINSGQNLHYSTADLSNGSYFIRIESSGLTGTGRFIVKH